jgi:hypothetical protein
MDVPEEAILELRGIGGDLIPDVPDWIGDDVDPVGEVIEPELLLLKILDNRIPRNHS